MIDKYRIRYTQTINISIFLKSQGCFSFSISKNLFINHFYIIYMYKISELWDEVTHPFFFSIFLAFSKFKKYVIINFNSDKIDTIFKIENLKTKTKSLHMIVYHIRTYMKFVVVFKFFAVVFIYVRHKQI